MSGMAHEEKWVVESLAESMATVEVDGKEVAHVPRWLLPSDARAGDVLSVTRTGSAEQMTVTVARDATATHAALEASARQMRDAPVDQKGGDITL